MAHRLVQLQQAPRTSEHAFGGEQHDAVGHVHSVMKKHSQVRQVARVCTRLHLVVRQETAEAATVSMVPQRRRQGNAAVTPTLQSSVGGAPCGAPLGAPG
eukprot:4352579-Prymnesium_polylepis.1